MASRTRTPAKKASPRSRRPAASTNPAIPDDRTTVSAEPTAAAPTVPVVGPGPGQVADVRHAGEFTGEPGASRAGAVTSSTPVYPETPQAPAAPPVSAEAETPVVPEDDAEDDAGQTGGDGESKGPGDTTE